MSIPQISGPVWLRYIGIAVLFGYGGLVALELVPAGKVETILSLLAIAGAWLAPSPSVRTGDGQ